MTWPQVWFTVLTNVALVFVVYAWRSESTPYFPKWWWVSIFGLHAVTSFGLVLALSVV